MRKSIRGLRRYPAAILIAWIVISLCLPFVRQVFREQTLLQGLALAILLQLLFVLHSLFQNWGWWRLLRVAVAVVIVAFAAQAISIRSGYPFGQISYDPSLQPRVMGVPVLLPLAWLMMLPTSWGVARLITRRISGCAARPAFIGVSALAFTAWDFFLDPLMVRLGLWGWNSTSGFFGVPWLNFFGWMLVSGIITFAISPKHLPGGLLVLVYATSWLIDFIIVIITGGLLIPALAGFCLMGGILLWSAMSS